MMERGPAGGAGSVARNEGQGMRDGGVALAEGRLPAMASAAPKTKPPTALGLRGLGVKAGGDYFMNSNSSIWTPSGALMKATFWAGVCWKGSTSNSAPRALNSAAAAAMSSTSKAICQTP